MNIFKRGVSAILALGAILVSGCGETISASPLNESRAREALKSTLDAWKAGAEPGSLSSSSITAQDLDWLGGSKLVDYQVEGEGKAIDSNLRVPVRLNLKAKDGKDVAKSVHYLVTTSPSVTVFRDIH